MAGLATYFHISNNSSRHIHLLIKPLIQSYPGTALETSRNVFNASQGTNEDDSQSNPHPEAGIFNNQMTQNSGPEDGHDITDNRIMLARKKMFVHLAHQSLSARNFSQFTFLIFP